jgi:outer membrane protein OmpA-like peptidoglycan-associated protein
VRRQILFKVEKNRVLVPVGEPCPFGCRYCYTRGGEVGLSRVSIEDILTPFRQFARETPFETIQFGYDGDPFSRPERGIAMLKELAMMGKHVNFSTKALLEGSTLDALSDINCRMQAAAGYDFNMATAGIAFHFPHRPPPPPPPPPPLPPPPPPPPPVAPPQAVIETIVLQSVHFEFDKSRLTPLGRRVLDEAAQKIKDNPRLSVVIEGNTDSIGTELYNLGLGQRRAEVVMGYLVLRHQVDPKRMTPLSYGESRPIADNRTAEGRALNRRVEFKVLVR